MHLPTLRLYAIFGPYEDPGRLIPTLIVHSLKTKLPPLADPEVARDFVYVDDVVEAYLLAASIPTAEWGPIYNVGTGVQTTLRDVVSVARQVMSIASEPAWSTIPNRQWDANVWLSDNRKIRTQLNWQPQRTFAEGFRLMLEWYLQTPLPAYADRGPGKVGA